MLDKKEKKPNFLIKLKAKVDEVFKNDNLTFIGQIFMLLIYNVIITISILIGWGVFSSLVECLLAVSKIDFKMSLGPASLLLVLGCVLSFAAVVCLIIYELNSLDENGESVLIKEIEE